MTTTATATAPAIAPAPVKHPNHYELSGDGISVVYSTTTFGGKPMLSYHDKSQSRSFVGDQIRTADTEIGTLVTVTLFLTPDSGSTTFTVLIPEINLNVSDSAPISTDGITTLHRLTIIGPPLQGQTELYTTHELKGTASFFVT